MNPKDIQKKVQKLLNPYRKQLAAVMHIIPPGPFVHLIFDVGIPMMLKGKNLKKFKNEETDLQFVFSGMPGVKKWVILIDHGKAKIKRGEVDYPRTIINAEARAFIDTITGYLNPEKALMAGRVTVSGPVAKMKAFQDLF